MIKYERIYVFTINILIPNQFKTQIYFNILYSCLLIYFLNLENPDVFHFPSLLKLTI